MKNVFFSPELYDRRINILFVWSGLNFRRSASHHLMCMTVCLLRFFFFFKKVIIKK